MRRRRLLVNGIVQGVGFRPYVVQTATALGLAGHVCNSSAGVVIEVEGRDEALAEFARRMQNDTPPLARVVSVSSEDVPVERATGFVIRPSQDTPGTSTMVPPDAATCADCLAEVRNPDNRRHGYPFTNCTNCGPRWTIIQRIPYDRPHTSMAPFTMCAACQAEYDDLSDRRFHAQPNACADCGPRIWLEGPLGATAEQSNPLEQAAEALARHAVLAIRGLGGFHLAVRADAAAAVDLLRQRKHRTGKPLAVMVPDLATVRRLAHPTRAEEALLESPAAPIVLVNKRSGTELAANVAPGHRRLGLMLPSTPLHHLLFDALAHLGIEAVVMTSGNTSEEPICIGNDEARMRLAGIADAFVLHDREILRRADDSVLQAVNETPLVLRRSRGLAPVPVLLGDSAAPPILAVGTQLKNTVCLLKDGRAFISPHIGDLGQLETDGFFRESVATLQDLLECAPGIIAHDLHPGYTATLWATEQARLAPQLTLVPVQHHHAHLAAVLAEHQLAGPVVGLIMDGTGYGKDGTIWGGEILLGDRAGFERLGHFETVPLPGGEAAIKAPWRQAVSYLRHAYGAGFFAEHPDEFPFQGDRSVAPVLEILERDVNSPLTSSCGRLFDAVAAMVGPWAESSYEAQAAIELAALTTAGEVREAQPFALVVEELRDRLEEWESGGKTDEKLELPVATMIRAVREARRAGLSPGLISAMFHRTLIEVLARAASWAAARHGVRDIVLAGGVFQNEILLGELENRLRRDGLHPRRPLAVPPGDGGVSLGQAAIAAARMVLPEGGRP